MARKWKDSRGLTLVETLCAVAILVLLGLLVNTGLNLAMRGYRELTAQSELELLGSTLTSALADELRYAREVETEADGSVTRFHSHRYNYPDPDMAYTELKVENGKLYAGIYQMVPDGAYNHGAYELRPGAFRVTCADGLFRVSLTVQQAGGGLSRTVEFTVRCLNYKPTT